MMGNKPSTNLAVVALSETAKMDNNPVKYPIAKETILWNIYVDNTFRVAPDLEQLYSEIEEIETVCKQDGFSFNKWITSSQDEPVMIIEVELPHQIGVYKEICIGVNWGFKNDLLFIKSNLDKPNKKLSKNEISLVNHMILLDTFYQQR